MLPVAFSLTELVVSVPAVKPIEPVQELAACTSSFCVGIIQTPKLPELSSVVLIVPFVTLCIAYAPKVLMIIAPARPFACNLLPAAVPS